MRTPYYWRLDGRRAVPATPEEAERCLHDKDARIVAQEEAGGYWISTLFLAINHQFGDGPPLLFETMLFPSAEGMHELDCERYETWEEAGAGHRRMLEKAKRAGALVEDNSR